MVSKKKINSGRAKIWSPSPRIGFLKQRYLTFVTWFNCRNSHTPLTRANMQQPQSIGNSLQKTTADASSSNNSAHIKSVLMNQVTPKHTKSIHYKTSYTIIILFMIYDWTAPIIVWHLWFHSCGKNLKSF